MAELTRRDYDVQLREAISAQRERDKIVELELVKIPRAKKGRGKPNLHQIATLLREDPRFTDRLAFNEAKGQVLADSEELTDAIVAQWALSLLRLYRFGDISLGTLQHAMVLVAQENGFNPVTDYLDRIVWDGVERINTAPSELLRVAESDVRPLHGLYLRRWLISAVARAYEPGCKVDGVLVLTGPQGSYKSSFFRVLGEGPGPGYVMDSPVEVGAKDGMQVLSGSWIVEWAELEDLIKSKAAGTVKAFITSATDTYRPSYGRCTTSVPRRCAIGSSTNVTQFLYDDTGNRRFYVVPNGVIEINRVLELRDQLWAEAVAAYRAGEIWWLTREETLEQIEANNAFTKGAAFRAALAKAANGRKTIPAVEVASLAESYGVSSLKTGSAMRTLGYEQDRGYVNGMQMRVWHKGSPDKTGTLEFHQG
jgi:putative DNA primase/helicase